MRVTSKICLERVTDPHGGPYPLQARRHGLHMLRKELYPVCIGSEKTRRQQHPPPTGAQIQHAGTCPNARAA